MEGAIARRLHNDNVQAIPFSSGMRNQPTVECAHCGRTSGNADGRTDTRTRERHEHAGRSPFRCRHSAAFHTPSLRTEVLVEGIVSSSPPAQSATCASKRSRRTTGPASRESRSWLTQRIGCRDPEPVGMRGSAAPSPGSRSMLAQLKRGELRRVGGVGALVAKHPVKLKDTFHVPTR